MAQTFAVQLSRPNSSVPWGFRLQGGADFSTPLSIQLVQPASVSETAGLIAGDGVLQINGVATETLDHEIAKMEIIRAGNEVNFLIMRGAVTTWRPKVTPMSELKPSELQTHSLEGDAPPIQKTSLAANKQPMRQIGSAHNRSARPFRAGGSTIENETHISVADSFPKAAEPAVPEHHNRLQQEYKSECGGYVPNVSYDPTPAQSQPGVVHAQYNTPMGVYSNSNINESFDQHADVMKNELGNMSLHENPATTDNNNLLTVQKPAEIANGNEQKPPLSPVHRALLEEGDPKMLYKGGSIQSRSFKMLETELEGGNSPTSVFPGQQGSSVLPAGVRSVKAPTTNPNANATMTGPRWKQPTQSCYVCNNPITGMFVRVKEHQLHADCLRCQQCRRSLKNIGYIWVGDKIYCVQHARELTRPPGGGYTAYVIDAPDA